MKKWFFFVFFLMATGLTMGFSNGFAATLCLKERFNQAESGSYVVTEQSKSFTFFYINQVQNGKMVIEEVTIPAARFMANKLSFREWFQKGAPGHTSWLISKINLETARFEETFSYTHQGWVDLSDSNSFLTTLLNLPFQPVEDKERRCIGLSKEQGKAEKRYWTPRVVVEGRSVSQVPFSVWKTRWPQDGSELSKKYIEIFLPELSLAANQPKFPTFFPFWIEVDGKIGSAKIRVVDSGTSAHSPKPGFPLGSQKKV